MDKMFVGRGAFHQFLIRLYWQTRHRLKSMDGLFVSRVKWSITELHGLQVKMAELYFNENRIAKAKLMV